MPPPVDEVWKDWVVVLEDRRSCESNFPPPTLFPVAGAPLPHSAGPLPRCDSAPQSARYHDHPAAYSPGDCLYDDDGLEERVDEAGLSGDNSVGHGSVKLPSWSKEEECRTQEEETVPLSDDSVPHFESIQERLRRFDEVDLSESRILLLEKIHQEMWAKLSTVEFIKWDDLPWPVFVRTTCPEDLMLYRIVSYLLQVSSGMDIKEALVDSSRLQWAQQRLRNLLGQWRQPGLQKKVENSADKTIIQGVNVVINHLESVLDFVNMHQIDKTHDTDLTAIIHQTFLKHVGENLARILKDTSDNSGYKSLLRLEGNKAQKMLNFLQTVRHVTAQYHHESHYVQVA